MTDKRHLRKPGILYITGEKSFGSMEKWYIISGK